MRRTLPQLKLVCHATLATTPEDIARQILDPTEWRRFHGYGPIPGIQEAVFEHRTPEILGSRIRVSNRDGSSHTEEIVQWQVGQTIQLKMSEFSAPLRFLADHFLETWEFQRQDAKTLVTRSFTIMPTSRATIPLLWLISLFLKQAIVRHLRDIDTQVQPRPGTN